MLTEQKFVLHGRLSIHSALPQQTISLGVHQNCACKAKGAIPSVTCVQPPSRASAARWRVSAGGLGGFLEPLWVRSASPEPCRGLLPLSACRAASLACRLARCFAALLSVLLLSCRFEEARSAPSPAIIHHGTIASNHAL